MDTRPPFPDLIRGARAQLTRRYSPDDLVGTSVLGVVNFPPRRIAGFVSEVLVLGVVDPADGGDVVLVWPDGGGDVRGWRLA
jgi:tRNA-binding protein